MSEELLKKLWNEYWAGKGFVPRSDGTFAVNENFPGLSELLLEMEQSGTTFPVPPQWVLYYRRKGYRITGSGSSLEVSHD